MKTQPHRVATHAGLSNLPSFHVGLARFSSLTFGGGTKRIDRSRLLPTEFVFAPAKAPMPQNILSSGLSYVHARGTMPLSGNTVIREFQLHAQSECAQTPRLQTAEKA